MLQQRPTYSAVEAIVTDRNYGIDDGVDVVGIKNDIGNIKIEDILAQHLEKTREVLIANHAKALASVTHSANEMRTEVSRLRQENKRLREELHGTSSGDHAYFSSSRNRWFSPDAASNSQFAKLDVRNNIGDSNNAVLAFGDSNGFEEAARNTNSRGFSAKRGRGKGFAFDLASVPVPMMMLANRQQPNLVVPANRRALAATPPTGVTRVQAVEVDREIAKANLSPLRDTHSLALPEGSPAQMEAVPGSDNRPGTTQNSIQATPRSDIPKLPGTPDYESHRPISGQMQSSKIDPRSHESSVRETLMAKVHWQSTRQTSANHAGISEMEEGNVHQEVAKSPRDGPKKRRSFIKGHHQSLSRSDSIKGLQKNVYKKNGNDGDNKGTVFADAEMMKEKVRAAIGRPEYNVTMFYKTTGWSQRIARNQIFESATLVVIALNAVWIGYDTDENSGVASLADAPLVFQVVENIFCAYFFLEWCVRFDAFARKIDCIKDMWFNFDSVLVVLMVFETWVMFAILKIMESSSSSGSMASSERLGDASVLKLLRLLRLTRMARMVRLLRAMPELMILIKGMAVAMRSVFFTLCLLMVIIYIFGIAFAQLTYNTGVGDQYFSNVPDAMNSLLLYGTLLEDTPDVVNACGDEHFGLRALFLLFILLASLTVMNMLVGVLVEVVSVVSSVEKEQLQVNFVKTRLFQMTEQMDANRDGLISKYEFEMLLQNPEAARALRDVGVDVVGLVDFHDFLFQDAPDLTFANFMEVVLSLRGTNRATVKDIVDLRKFLSMELGRLSMAVNRELHLIQHYFGQQTKQTNLQRSPTLELEAAKDNANDYP